MYVFECNDCGYVRDCPADAKLCNYCGSRLLAVKGVPREGMVQWWLGTCRSCGYLTWTKDHRGNACGKCGAWLAEHGDFALIELPLELALNEGGQDVHPAR